MKINTILKTWSLVVVVGTLQGCELFEIFSECSTFTLGGTGQTPEHCDKAKMMEIAQNQKNYDEYVLKLPQPLPCVKEQKLKVDPEISKIYTYAYFTEINNEDNRDPEFWLGLYRYYNIALTYGDTRAFDRLNRIILLNRMGSLELGDRVEYELIYRQYAKFKPAFANYYKYRSNMMIGPYLYPALQAGNVNAMLRVASIAANANDVTQPERAKKIKDDMWMCASEQGDGYATRKVAERLQEAGKHREALEKYQLALAQGDRSSAEVLSKIFVYQTEIAPQRYYQDMIRYNLDLGADDPARSQRYKDILKLFRALPYFLSDDDEKIPELNQIIPLPPAKLPKWDGTITAAAWLKGATPEKPDEQWLTQLALNAGLDPVTGRPLPKIKQETEK